MTKLIAIDSSTKSTGIALFIDGVYRESLLLSYPTSIDMTQRFRNMSLSILSVLKKYSPDIVYIEETVVVRNPQVQRFLTRLQGVVYGWCIQNNCCFETIRPTEWRKLSGIKQSKQKRDQLKKMAIEKVKEDYAIDVNDDVAESILIGQAVINKFSKSPVK